MNAIRTIIEKASALNKTVVLPEGMDPRVMRRIEETTGFDDWTDPQLSAIYWGARGNCADIVRQATVLYLRNHKKEGPAL